jgi:hypothetical protein
MKDHDNLPPYADLIARVLCLVIAAAWATGAAFAHAAGPSSTIWFWLLTGAATAFTVVAFFGPRSLRTALVGWFPW